jgi:Leucine-rich repeat (LRR) protein
MVSHVALQASPLYPLSHSVCAHCYCRDLAFNNYNMSVPDLTPMANLEFLFMTSNDLGGNVPQFVADLEHLQIADFSGNWFTDPVPNFRENYQLFRLHLGDNCIRTIENRFENVTTITWLNLRENFITTISPESYEWMSQQLLFIDLSSNLIIDPFPEEFFDDDSSLSFVSLAYNNYTGKFPLRRSCALPKNLLYVDISHTSISDLEIAYPSCPYPALSYLDVSSSMIQWELDASIVFFTGLQYLDLSSNPELTGSMKLLSYVRSLIMLRVDETGLRQEPECDDVCVPDVS